MPSGTATIFETHPGGDKVAIFKMKQNVYRVGGIYFKMKDVVEMYPGVSGNLYSPGILFLFEGMDAGWTCHLCGQTLHGAHRRSV